MKNIKTVKFLAVLVSFFGFIIMTGWYLEIEVLKSILPIWVSMKFTTALSFFISGFILYFSESLNKEISNFSRTILLISTLILWLIMTTFLFSTLLSTRTGIEDVFVLDTVGAIKTSTPGRPSIGTELNFMLISFVGFLGMYELKKRRLYIYVISLLIISLAAVAILGYLFSAPILYYYFEGYSSAMAIHTAILFVVLGIGFFIIGKTKMSNTKIK